MTSKIALVIIDQQKGIDHPKLGQRNNLDAEDKILYLLEFWRSLAYPVIHVKHRSKDPDSVFWPEQEGFDFKPEFEPKPGEEVIEKSVPCAFTNNCLQFKLDSLGMTNLAIVGVATNNSVESTARSAGNLGFRAYVIEDACYAFAKNDYFGNPRTPIEVHAMSLANIHGEYARVLSCHDFLTGLSSLKLCSALDNSVA